MNWQEAALRARTFGSGLWLAAGFIVPGAVFAAVPMERPRDGFFADRYLAGIARLEELQRVGRARPADHFWAGRCAMRLHRWEEAETELGRARQLGFVGPPRGPSTESWLDRLAVIRRLTPVAQVLAFPHLTLHTDVRTAWTGPVIDAFPAFARIGTDMYGTKTPDMDFYLFAEREAYLAFCRAVFERPVDEATRNGTASTRFAMACQVGARPAGLPETIGDVVHELGHGWANTYVRLTYDRDYGALVAPYANEGMAGVVSAQWDRGHLDRRRDWIRRMKVARHVPPPAFADLQTADAFYRRGDETLNYWLSNLLMDRLLGADGCRRVPAYLDALVATGDTNRALRQVTGRDPEAEYRSLVNEFWGITASP